MFHQLLFIHLYRPFLKYTKSTSPLPQHVSPRRICTQAASAISKLLRIYKRTYGLRQICNIAVYIVHSACTIHLLNLPDKNAKRDLVHGLRNLEEIAEGWLCARRTLRILDITASKWRIELPEEAVAVFERAYAKWGSWGAWDHGSSPATSEESPTIGKSTISSTAYAGHSRERDFSTSIEHRQHRQQQQYESQPPATSVPFASTAPAFQQPLFSNVSHLYSAGPDRRSFSSYAQQPPQASLPEQSYVRPESGIVFPQSAALQQSQQQDMWSAGQDLPCNNSNSSNSPATVTGTPPMPIFNGIAGNTMEESQEWLLQDQSALALGLENWGEGWAGNHFGMGIDMVSPSQPQHTTSASMPPPSGRTTANLQQIPGGTWNDQDWVRFHTTLTSNIDCMMYKDLFSFFEHDIE